MHYTLNQLDVFVKVVEAQSVTKASKELHMSQPAVSIQLRNFQDQFDVPLTEVVGRKLYVTEFGYEIAEAAKNILLEVDKINHRAKTYKGLLTGKIKIAVKSSGKYVMPYFLGDFMKTNAEVELKMEVSNSYQVMESLENNTIDFALVSILPQNLNIECIDLLPNKLFFVCKSDEEIPLNSSLKEICGRAPILFREQGSGTRLMMESFFNSNDIKVEKQIVLVSNEAVKQAVLAGLGYSIVPLIGIRNELNNAQLKIFPIKDLPIITHWRLIWLKSKKLSPVAAAFVAYLKQEKSNIVQNTFSWCDKY